MSKIAYLFLDLFAVSAKDHANQSRLFKDVNKVALFWGHHVK